MGKIRTCRWCGHKAAEFPGRTCPSCHKAIPGPKPGTYGRPPREGPSARVVWVRLEDQGNKELEEMMTSAPDLDGAKLGRAALAYLYRRTASSGGLVRALREVLGDDYDAIVRGW